MQKSELSGSGKPEETRLVPDFLQAIFEKNIKKKKKY